MTTEEILQHIDAEISRLTEARNLISGEGSTRATRKTRKPRSGAGPAAGAVASKPRAAKRVISPEGRARIAAAQKLRWAKQKRGKAKA